MSTNVSYTPESIPLLIMSVLSGIILKSSIFQKDLVSHYRVPYFIYSRH